MTADGAKVVFLAKFECELFLLMGKRLMFIIFKDSETHYITIVYLNWSFVVEDINSPHPLHRLVDRFCWCQSWCLTHFPVDVDVECASADVQVSGLLCLKQCFWVDIETLNLCVTSHLIGCIHHVLNHLKSKSSSSRLLYWLSSPWCNCCATDLYSRDKFLLINFLFRSVAVVFPLLSLSSSSSPSLW